LAPKRGAERKRLISNCGPKCFLIPELRKFPICRRCAPDRCFCRPDCMALRAAVIRGRQWGYESVANRARQMHDDMGCVWPSRKRGQKKTRHAK
jgi:hypothetical protein